LDATASSANEGKMPIFGIQIGLVNNSNWFPGLMPTEYLLKAATPHQIIRIAQTAATQYSQKKFEQAQIYMRMKPQAPNHSLLN
jgi:hypothetical protein